MDTSKYKGKQIIDQMIKQQAERYEKKFSFEKGIYHQCIPNPKNSNQRITVQLIERNLVETIKRSRAQNSVKEMFKDKQFASVSEARSYERFNLIAPDDNIR